MTTDDLVKQALQARGSGEKLLATFEEALGLLAARTPSDGAMDHAAATVFDETARTVLDWMGAGETKKLKDLVDDLRAAIYDAGYQTWLDRQTGPLPLIVRLQVMEELARLYLNTSNLAHQVAKLSGTRRSAWRKALKFMYVQGAPVSTADLVKNRVFRRESAARAALNEFAALWIASQTDETHFDLTCAGRRLCRVLGLVP